MTPFLLYNESIMPLYFAYINLVKIYSIQKHNPSKSEIKTDGLCFFSYYNISLSVKPAMQSYSNGI